MQWCLMNGEKSTGVTTMFMDTGLDTGDMLLKREVPLTEDMNLSGLHDLLMMEGAELLRETVKKISEGSIVREKQDDSLSCYAPMITKETGRINWGKTSGEIHNLVRGLDPNPGAYTFLEGKKYKILKTKKIGEKAGPGTPGTILEAGSEGIDVVTGDGILRILELQAPGGKRMESGDYLRGHSMELPLSFDKNTRF